TINRQNTSTNTNRISDVFSYDIRLRHALVALGTKHFGFTRTSERVIRSTAHLARSTRFEMPSEVPGLERSAGARRCAHIAVQVLDRKSTRLNSSHGSISYAVFCL